MSRLARVLAAAALTLTIAGCDGGGSSSGTTATTSPAEAITSTSGPAAAVVNGRDVSARSVRAEVDVLVANQAYAAQRKATGRPSMTTAKGRPTAAFTAEVLARRIAQTALGIDPPPTVSGRAAKAGEAEATDAIGGADVFDAFPTAYRRLLTQRAAALLKARLDAADLTSFAAAAPDFYETHRDLLERVCARGIVVATLADAQAVRADLLGGADFAATAKARSTDANTAPSGGDLGCAYRGTVTEPGIEEALFTLEPGTLSTPIQSSRGFHLVIIDEREVPSEREARPHVIDLLEAEATAAFDARLRTVLLAATVTVDPAFGAWDAETGTVTRRSGSSTSRDG